VAVMTEAAAGGQLEGQVALITGAGRGIGAAIAEGFAAEGAAVGCLARTASEIEAVAARIVGSGGRALAVRCDVTDEAAVGVATEAVAEAFGGLDTVVLNAGGNLERSTVAEGGDDAWRATVDLNLVGAYHGARAAIPHLRARGGGRIITIGSGLGQRGAPGLSAYAAAKAGLSMLTRVLAQELLDDRISVNELIPGPVDTSDLDRDAEGVSPLLAANPGEWLKRPEDVVPLAVFLAAQPLVGPTAQRFSLMRRDG
jgi:3-oxoacyl-[acyl-carrier protein] reductase